MMVLYLGVNFADGNFIAISNDWNHSLPIVTYFIKSKRVISSNRASASLRTSNNESSIETTGSATTGIITGVGIPQARTPTTSSTKQQHISSISHTIQSRFVMENNTHTSRIYYYKPKDIKVWNINGHLYH